MKRWRVGKKLGRTIYDYDVCVGMVDTPEVAAAIVAALNGACPECSAVDRTIEAMNSGSFPDQREE